MKNGAPPFGNVTTAQPCQGLGIARLDLGMATQGFTYVEGGGTVKTGGNLIPQQNRGPGDKDFCSVQPFSLTCERCTDNHRSVVLLLPGSGIGVGWACGG